METLNANTPEDSTMESFTDYLRRVGADTGSTCTAEDYTKAAARIDALEHALRDLIKWVGPSGVGKEGRYGPKHPVARARAVLDTVVQP